MRCIVEAAIRTEIRAPLRDLPPGVGYGSANALILTDALGEILTLPWNLVATYDVSKSEL